ncbi:MAG: hypothetical protein ACKVQV_09915 [Bacteroidia bacterium]
MIIFDLDKGEMKAAAFKFNLIESYLRLLNHLSPDNKLKLLTKLSDSLKEPNNPSKKSIRDLYGSFLSKKSADEINTDLKEGRSFNRKTEGL